MSIEPRPVKEAQAPSHILPDLSPEARRLRAQRWREDLQHHADTQFGAQGRFWGTRLYRIVQRVWNGAWNDGFIHAGNLAYMAILALFPFIVVVSLITSLVGEEGQRVASVHTFLLALPPLVRKVIEPVALDVVRARTGWLLWAGGLVGLWTVGSLIETIRDILRRAYGTRHVIAYWRYRLISTGVIVLAAMALLISLFMQVAIGTAQQVIAALYPRAGDLIDQLGTSRLIPALLVFGSLYLLFYALTPTAYRSRTYPKWPGALLVTLWWAAVSSLLPFVMAHLFTYSLTYGSLAGVMVALFFFWLVGLGMVVGAELNAALAVTPEERDMASLAVTESNAG